MKTNVPIGGAGKFPVDGGNIIPVPVDKENAWHGRGAAKKIEHDRINNVTQKEEAMALSGVTRRKTYRVIARLLDAKKWAEVTDKGGNVRWEWVEDLEKQRQGAEMALKVMGDMIEHKQVEYGIADSTLEKLKAMSVDALKARARELIEGRKVVEAEVINSGGVR